MDISIIIFAAIVVCGISFLPFAFKGIHKLFKDFFHYQEHKETKIQLEKIEDKKNELKETIDSGNLTDLLNSTKELGEEQRKKKKQL